MQCIGGYIRMTRDWCRFLKQCHWSLCSNTLIRRELLEQTLWNKCWQWNVGSVFLHLLLCILRALECEVLQPRQHLTPCIHGADKFVGWPEGNGKSQVLRIILWLLRRDISCWAFQPADNLVTATRTQLGIWKGSANLWTQSECLFEFPLSSVAFK